MPGLYNSDGAIRVTVVDGLSVVGAYAEDGSWNVIEDSNRTGAYHPSGARRVIFVDGDTVRGIYAPDGSIYISETKGSPFDGSLFVEIVAGFPVVADQTLVFGNLTKAGDGGITPINTGGIITSASIDSGDSSGHWHVSPSGVITPTSTGDSANLSGGPYTLGCSFGGISATITITILADTYSVRPNPAGSGYGSNTEFTRALDAMGTSGGKTIAFRPGVELIPTDEWYLYRRNGSTINYTFLVTITSHDNADRVRFNNTAAGVPSYIRGPRNTKFTKVAWEGVGYGTGIFAANPHAFRFSEPIGGTLGLTIEDCDGYGHRTDYSLAQLEAWSDADYLALGDAGLYRRDYSNGLLYFESGADAVTGPVVIRGNSLRSAGMLLFLPRINSDAHAAASLLVENNLFADFGDDAINYFASKNSIIRWNDFKEPYSFAADPSHMDFLQRNPSDLDDDHIEIYGNRMLAARAVPLAGQKVATQGPFLQTGLQNSFNTQSHSRIFGNIIYTPVGQGIWSDRVGMQSSVIVANTIVAPAGTALNSQPYVYLDSDVSADLENNVVADNAVASVVFSKASTPVTPPASNLVTNNKVIDASTTGLTGSYDTNFDGIAGAFAPLTLAQLMTTFVKKAGGPLDTAAPKIGALPYVNFDGYAPMVGRTPVWDIPRLNDVADFTITDLTGQELSTLVTSAATLIADINDSAGNTSAYGALVRLAGGTSPQFRITSDAGGSSVVTNWTSTPAIIQQGQYLWVRDTTSGSNSTAVNVSVYVGDELEAWSITTKAAAAWTTVWDRTTLFTASAVASNGWNGYTIALVIPLSGLSATGGTKIRLTFDGGPTEGSKFSAAYVGNGGGGDAYDFTGTPVQLHKSAGTTITSAAGSSVVTDGDDFVKDGTNPLVVKMQLQDGTADNMDGITGNVTISPVFGAGYSTFYKSGAEAGTANASGFTTYNAEWVSLSKVELLI